MKFFCKDCSGKFDKSTKYHLCKCGGKLFYQCPRCDVTFGANYQTHLKICKFESKENLKIKIESTEKEEKIQIKSYKYGKEKIIAVTNVGEITVAYFCSHN